MNWGKIKNDCPKAWNVFHKDRSWLEVNSDKKLGHYYTDGVHIIRMWMTYNIKDLFDFFDDTMIYIEIDQFGNGLFWAFSFWEKLREYKRHGMESRSEAESSAFEKAFEILEERLNKEK